MQVPPGPLSRDDADKLSKLLSDYQSSQSDRNPSFIGASAPNWRGGNYTDNIVPNVPFPVKLTDFDTGLYEWTEQYSSEPDYAGWNDLPGGRTGTFDVNPAFEPNDAVIDITDEPVVWIQRAYYDPDLDWVYVIVGTTGSGGGSSSLTVKESDGSPSCPNITTLVFDASKMTVVCDGGGQATISVKSHSVTVVTDVVCNDDGTISLTTTDIEVVG